CQAGGQEQDGDRQSASGTPELGRQGREMRREAASRCRHRDLRGAECLPLARGEVCAVYARTRWSILGQQGVNRPAMLRLHTFGGVSSFRGDENLTGAVTQRRRLGIRVLLATAGSSVLSRD